MGLGLIPQTQIIAERVLSLTTSLPTPIVITVLGIVSGLAGIWLSSLRGLAQRLVSFGGGVLAGVAAFWLLPEMAEFLGWPVAIAWLFAGVILLAGIDRYVYTVCPACAGPHDHDHCAQSLHGFAAPLIIAASLHAALDGWSLRASGEQSIHLGPAFGFAIGIHKIPEGIALGVMLRAALSRLPLAVFWCVIAEAATLAGAAGETILAPQLTPQLFHILLALAGGSFLYLGGHAIHGEWRRSGFGQAFVPAIAGLACPSILRLFRLI